MKVGNLPKKNSFFSLVWHIFGKIICTIIGHNYKEREGEKTILICYRCLSFRDTNAEKLRQIRRAIDGHDWS